MRRFTIATAAAPILLACSGMFDACATTPASPTPEPPVAPASDGATARSEGSSDELAGTIFGINEGMSVPLKLVQSGRLDTADQDKSLTANAALLGELGVHSNRANSHNYPYLHYSTWKKKPAVSQARGDRFFRAVAASSLSEVVMVLGPLPGIQTANYADHYVPADLDGYAAFVRAVVERYDGDGVDDMPGLRLAPRYWELDNEPDLHFNLRPRTANRDTRAGTFETPEEYARVSIVTAQAIREADPTAKILLGGMYNPRDDPGRAYLDAVLAQPGMREAFDILNFHCYRDEDSLAAMDRTIAIAREVAPDRPLWITEFGVSTEGKPFQNETWQARMLVGLYGEGLASGVARMFWHSLADPPPDPRDTRKRGFAHHSLYRTIKPPWAPGAERQIKTSGETYRRLVQLIGGVPRSELRRGEAGAGARLLWAGADGAGLVYWGEIALPADRGSWQVTDLLTGAERTVEAGRRVSAPAWIRPTTAER